MSATKLPPTVPKVNSKWDGVPDIQRDREKKRHSQRQSFYECKEGLKTPGSQDGPTRVSTASSGGSRSGRGYGRAGPASVNKLSELYGWESSSSTHLDSCSGLDVRSTCSSTQAAGPHRQHNPDGSDLTSTCSRSRSSTADPGRGADGSGSSHGVSPLTSRELGLFDRSRSSDHGAVPVVGNRFLPAAVRSAPTSSSGSSLDRVDPTEPTSGGDGDHFGPASHHSPATSSASSRTASRPRSISASPHEWHPTRATDPKVSPRSQNVMVRSTGRDMLSPPSSARRKADGPAATNADGEGTAKGPDEQMPHSILKKATVSRRFRGPHRPGMSSYFATLDQPDGDETQSSERPETHPPTSPGRIASVPLRPSEEPGEGQDPREGSLTEDLGTPGLKRGLGLRNALKRRSKVPSFGSSNP